MNTRWTTAITEIDHYQSTEIRRKDILLNLDKVLYFEPYEIKNVYNIRGESTVLNKEGKPVTCLNCTCATLDDEVSIIIEEDFEDLVNDIHCDYNKE